MNKHDSVVERLRIEISEAAEARVDLPWLENAADLLQLYGDALERLGDYKEQFTVPAKGVPLLAYTDSDELDARIQYARDTIEEGIE